METIARCPECGGPTVYFNTAGEALRCDRCMAAVPRASCGHYVDLCRLAVKQSAYVRECRL